MAIEQVDETPSQYAQMPAALGVELEERARTGGCMMQSIHGAMGATGALLGDQRLDMTRVFDLLTTIEAARMGGDDIVAVEHPHALLSCHNLQRAADMSVRNGVIVQIKAHVRALVRWDIHAFLTRKRLGGQGEQSRQFFLEARAHTASAMARSVRTIARARRSSPEAYAAEAAATFRAASRAR